MTSVWEEHPRRRAPDFTSQSAGFRTQTTRECRRRREFYTPLPESTTTNGAAAGRRPARRGGGGAARRRAARTAAGLKAMRVDGNGLKARWGAEEGARQGAFAARPRKSTSKQPSGGGSEPRGTGTARARAPPVWHLPPAITPLVAAVVFRSSRRRPCAKTVDLNTVHTRHPSAEACVASVREVSQAPRRRRRCVALRRAAAAATATELRPRRLPRACACAC